MFVSELEGILFVEGDVPGGQVLGPLKVTLDGYFVDAQLKSLDDVKKQIVSKVTQAGGNALLQFKYGQRSASSWWSFSRDNVLWYGEGVIALLPDKVFEGLRPR